MIPPIGVFVSMDDLEIGVRVGEDDPLLISLDEAKRLLDSLQRAIGRVQSTTLATEYAGRTFVIVDAPGDMCGNTRRLKDGTKCPGCRACC